LPELPEVETTLRGLAPHLLERRIREVDVRERRLRWPVPRQLGRKLRGQRLLSLERRAKYLLFRTQAGCMIVHLGMSGSLRIVPTRRALHVHDRVALRFEGGMSLRLRDPRRFGSVLWSSADPLAHPLLAPLGPEPLGAEFDGGHLHRTSRGRRIAVKPFLMDGRVVAGVGNIYANEALFLAGIHPARAAGRISPARYESLACGIREVLERAIEAGGTTLRDFVGSDGSEGWFEQDLEVYGRAGEPCRRCGQALAQRVIGQRSSFFCTRCQR
jgi:formamidopyrimidine-DNA glycosylase